MNRHQPSIQRFDVGPTPRKVYEPSDGARSIATVLENHGSSVVRLLFTDTGAEPDPDKYLSLHPGQPIETNPPICVWAYSPSGATVPLVAATGVRYVGEVATDGDSSSFAVIADQLAELRGQKQLLAEIGVLLRIGLRYLAEWQGEEFNTTDALEPR